MKTSDFLKYNKYINIQKDIIKVKNKKKPQEHSIHGACPWIKGLY